MTSNISLSSIFNETKDELASSLSGLMLPKDSKEIQVRITQYLNNVCDEENEYRQNLTQSEDYILQSALSMLNAQCEMVSTLSHTPKVEVIDSSESIRPSDSSTRTLSTISLSTTNALLGSGGGALIGKLVFGGWGAVFGAIAGSAIILYLSQQNTKTNLRQLSGKPQSKAKVKIIDVPLNVTSLLNVIGQVCESLDNLIATFRAQIQRVINKYESQEKPTIERDYRVLLEGIQSLLGYKRGHSETDEKYLSKLQNRIEDLADLLDNYDLEAVDYTSDKAHWFDAIESEKASEIKLVTPAIVKEGNLIIKGKIFIPKA
ncbi:MAG: hypothetical protein K2L34_06430 [Muribaculaceae bacterium]|nr:hypothetical protein [Muribaculaceae bacterium]